MRTLYLGCARAVRRKLREIQPDIVHGQGTERECAVSAVLSGFPNVLTIHGNMRAIARFYHAKPFSFFWLAAKLEQWALKKTIGVFCNSFYTEKLVASCANKTWHVPNAVRPSFFSPPSQQGQFVPVLLNIGVTSPYKRQLEILAVAKMLWERGLRFEMHFVGALNADTPYGSRLSQRLMDAQTMGYARHLGVLNEDKLVKAMDAASALVHFPVEEAFGLVVAEGLARNLKFFGSRTGGIPDIADGIDGAELFASNDFDGLTKAIEEWIRGGSPRATGANAVIRKRYHPRVIAQRHLEIYQEVLDFHGLSSNP